MSKLTPAKPGDVIKILEKLGFKRVRQSGSHAVFYHPDGRWTTVPIHKGKDVAKGALHKILKDVGLSYEEFKKIK
ncbi:addiction module toxin, HicA family [bacterium]|nr:addiction module toxin, HicA family [bacterium]